VDSGAFAAGDECHPLERLPGSDSCNRVVGFRR
jgi:hypothetical protein